ncbi:MAG: hypothetical protein ABJV60_00050, partial [Lentilitoribacter sp.]
MKHYRYCSHGIIINSEIEIAEYQAADDQRFQPDVHIKLGDVAKTGIANPKWQRHLTQVNIEHVWMDVPGVARFLITKGIKITVDPYPGADNADLCAFLVGSCMGAILHQRDFLVLHASAVVFQDKLIAICGQSGAGKSTTASTFAQRGAQIFTDDILVIDSHGQAWPGAPNLRLWKSSLDALGKDVSDYQQIRRKLPKFSIPVTKPWPQSGSRSVDAVVILERHEFVEHIDCISEPIAGIQKFRELEEQIFRRDAIFAMGHNKKHMIHSAAFVKNIPMLRLKRPTSKFSGNEVTQSILDWVLPLQENLET